MRMKAAKRDVSKSELIPNKQQNHAPSGNEKWGCLVMLDHYWLEVGRYGRQGERKQEGKERKRGRGADRTERERERDEEVS